MSGPASALATSGIPTSEGGQGTVSPVADSSSPVKMPAFPPYPPYVTEPPPPSVVDTIIAGRGLRLKHKSIRLRKPVKPVPRPARPRGPKATDVKMSAHANRAYARCLRRHGAILTDRLEHLSKPLRRTIIYLWRERAYTLPPETIARLRAMLDADEPFKPDQAYEYFVNLKKTQKQRAAKERGKEVKKDMLNMVGEKRFQWARSATVAFARGIQQRLSKPGRYALVDGMQRLSNIIMDDMCTYMHTRTPSRRSMNPKARFLMEMSDKIAVWIDEILSESQDRMLVMDFDEDEDITGGRKGAGDDTDFTDDFLRMMADADRDGGAGGTVSTKPRFACSKFQGNMKKAFEILTDAMEKKGSDKLVSHGKFVQTYRAAANTLQRAPDLSATQYSTSVAESINKNLTDLTQDITPPKVTSAMKDMVDLCSNYLAQNAEFNKNKGPAFNMLVSAMRGKRNEKMYEKGKIQRTYTEAATDLDKAEGLESSYDDPNLSQEIHSAMTKLVQDVPKDLKQEMAGTVDECSKYLSQKAVDGNERGPAFDLLIKELEKLGGETFTKYPAINTTYAAAYVLKSAPGLKSVSPDPTTSEGFKIALHKVADAATPDKMKKDMKDVIDRCGDYLSGFIRDRGPAMELLLGEMRKNPRKVYVKKNGFTMDNATAAADIENAPTLVPYLPVKDIAEAGKASLNEDVKNVTPAKLKVPMQTLINDASQYLSQSIALRSGAAGEKYSMNFLSAVKKSLGNRPLYKYKAYGQTYADAAETLQNAGPVESAISVLSGMTMGSRSRVQLKSEEAPSPAGWLLKAVGLWSDDKPKREIPKSTVNLGHEIESEMKRGVPVQLTPSIAADLEPAMEKAAKQLANIGTGKGKALDYVVDQMKDKGEVKLGTLQGYDQTFNDGARRLENAPTLTNEKVDQAAYVSVKGKLAEMAHKDKPSADIAKHVPGIIEESAKFLTAPVPETKAEKNQVLGDIMGRKEDEILGQEGVYKMTYQEGGEQLKKAPVGVTKANDEEKNKDIANKIGAMMPDSKMAVVLQESTKEGAAHLADVIEGRGQAMAVIQESLRKEKSKEFVEVGAFSKTHEQVADMVAEAPNFRSEKPSPVILENVEHKLAVLQTDEPTIKPLAKEHMEDAAKITAKFIAAEATKESGFDAQQLTALKNAGFNAEAEAAAEKRRLAAVEAGPSLNKDGGAYGMGASTGADGAERTVDASTATSGPGAAGPGGFLQAPDGVLYGPDGAIIGGSRTGDAGAGYGPGGVGQAPDGAGYGPGGVGQGPDGTGYGPGGVGQGPGGAEYGPGSVGQGPDGAAYGPGGVGQGPGGSGGVGQGPSGAGYGPGGVGQGPDGTGYVPGGVGQGPGGAGYGPGGVGQGPGSAGYGPGGVGQGPSGAGYGPGGVGQGPDGTGYVPGGVGQGPGGAGYGPGGVGQGPDGAGYGTGGVGQGPGGAGFGPGGVGQGPGGAGYGAGGVGQGPGGAGYGAGGVGQGPGGAGYGPGGVGQVPGGAGFGPGGVGQGPGGAGYGPGGVGQGPDGTGYVPGGVGQVPGGAGYGPGGVGQGPDGAGYGTGGVGQGPGGAGFGPGGVGQGPGVAGYGAGGVGQGPGGAGYGAGGVGQGPGGVGFGPGGVGQGPGGAGYGAGGAGQGPGGAGYGAGSVGQGPGGAGYGPGGVGQGPGGAGYGPGGVGQDPRGAEYGTGDPIKKGPSGGQALSGSAAGVRGPGTAYSAGGVTQGGGGFDYAPPGETEEQRRRRLSAARAYREYEEAERRRLGDQEYFRRQAERWKREQQSGPGKYRHGALGADYDPEHESALDILHNELQAHGEEVFYQQPKTILTHVKASEWLAAQIPMKVDQAVKDSHDTARLSKKFEKKLDAIVRTKTPPELNDCMQDVIIEAARRLSEFFIASSYNTVANEALIDEMQKRGNEILTEVGDETETYFFAAQRLKKANTLDVEDPCYRVANDIAKKLDDVVRTRPMARKLKMTMKDHIKEASNFLSAVVTKPDGQIEAYIAMLDEMEAAGDATLINANISKTYEESADYLRKLTSFEDKIDLPNPPLQADVQEKLRHLMSRAPSSGYRSEDMDIVIAESAKLLVSYVMLQGEKTQVMKILIQEMEKAGDNALLRHGPVRKSFKEGVDLLRKATADQLSNVSSTDPVVTRKIQLKLNALMQDKTPPEYDELMYDVIHEATNYLAVKLLQSRVIKVCKCKDVIVQCELWLEEILRYVPRQDCTCSRHASIQGLQVSASKGGVDISIKPCLIPKKTPEQGNLTDTNAQKPTTSFAVYGFSHKSFGYHFGRLSSAGSSNTASDTTTSSSAPTQLTKKSSPLKSFFFDIHSDNKEFFQQQQEQLQSYENRRRELEAASLSDFSSPSTSNIETTLYMSPSEVTEAKSGYSSRTPIITADQMADWHAMMVSLMWNVQAWRNWIQEIIDHALAYQRNPNTAGDNADPWSSFHRRIITEALQWRQYSLFSRQLTTRLHVRYRDEEIQSPTQSFVTTRTYIECQEQMLGIIDIFNSWTQWLSIVVKETESLRPTAGSVVPLHQMRWHHFKKKVEEYSKDWTKYNTFLKVSWEQKYSDVIAYYLPEWKKPGPVWVVSACGAVPSGAVAAGVNAGEVIWVARTTHRQKVLPAALFPCKHSCIVYADGAAHRCTKYQVMCNAEVQWVAWRDGSISERAVPVAAGLFVGRVHYHGDHLLGAVHAPHYRCNVVIFGRSFAFNCYELLLFTSNRAQ